MPARAYGKSIALARREGFRVIRGAHSPIDEEHS